MSTMMQTSVEVRDCPLWSNRQPDWPDVQPHAQHESEQLHIVAPWMAEGEFLQRFYVLRGS